MVPTGKVGGMTSYLYTAKDLSLNIKHENARMVFSSSIILPVDVNILLSLLFIVYCSLPMIEF